MMVIETDWRRIVCEDAPDAVAAAERAVVKRREADLELARALREIERTKAYKRYGCSSVAMYAGRLGLAPNEVRPLLGLARAMEVDDSIEERVTAKALSVPAAAEIAPLLQNETLPLYERDHWIDRAQKARFTNVRNEARARLAEIRCGEAVVPVRVHVPESVSEDFVRAGVIASGKAGRSLTQDETFEAVVDHYLDSFDELRTEEGTRRTGPTAEEPGKRYVPVSVKRAIRRRAGDMCEFPGCDRRKFLELAHRRPWRFGSGREADDLMLLCWDHHVMFDANFHVAIGPTQDPTWVDNLGLCYTRDRPYGRDPETERELRVVRAMAARGENPNRQARSKRWPAPDPQIGRAGRGGTGLGRTCSPSRPRSESGSAAEPLFETGPSP
jgi:hypothetical protein